MGRGTSKVGSGGGGGGAKNVGVIAKSDYQIPQDIQNVINALGIRSDINNIINDIDNAESVFTPISPTILASNPGLKDVKEYEIDTDYGLGLYWKNPGENFYRITDPISMNVIQAPSQQAAVTHIKNSFLKKAINSKIESVIYTGTSSGIGFPEYTAVGQRYQNVLKKAGFNGV